MENGDGSRTSSQCSLEVLWDKAFLLPNNIATKNWHFFLVEGDPSSQCVLRPVSNQTLTCHVKGKGRKDERLVVLSLK